MAVAFFTGIRKIKSTIAVKIFIYFFISLIVFYGAIYFVLYTPFPPDSYRDFPQWGKEQAFPPGGNKKGGLCVRVKC